MLESRNTTLGFAKRTRKNLVNVKQAFESGKDFHVVTHLVNSLLGIVVVPKQRYCKAEFLSLPLEEIYRDGWPRWDITLDEPKGNQGKTEILERLGCVDISPQPDESGGEMKEAQISGVQLLKPGEYPPIVLYFVDEAFDQVTLPV